MIKLLFTPQSELPFFLPQARKMDFYHVVILSLLLTTVVLVVNVALAAI